jgi:hypothetical protein
MRPAKFQKTASLVVLAGLMITVSVLVHGQYSSNTRPQTESKTQGPTLTATLVDAAKKAQQKAATVSVETTGIKLTDPASVNEQAKAGQGHLHYQVDGGPIIATTATKLSFHGLTPGAHKIVVMLAGNDHNPLGPQQTLEVTIP